MAGPRSRRAGFEAGRSPREEQQAREHLGKAIEHYRKAVEIDPNHVLSELGLGWCLDQAGDRDGALAAYRRALELAWKREKDMRSIEAGASATEEIAAYMLKLLDPQRDAEEIRTLQGYQETLRKKPRWITPIVVPQKAGVTVEELVRPRAGLAFDLDGAGSARRWGWITSKAAWLVYDDGHGRVTSGLQMLGGVTFWIFWENGYHALAALDDDGAGELRGEELRGLALWRDGNGNGFSEPGEVLPLAAWGVTGLSCRYSRHETGIPFSPAGARLRDGTTRPTYDWVVAGR